MGFFKKQLSQFMSRSASVIDSLENNNWPWHYFLFTFIFSVTFRTLVEIFSDRSYPELFLYLHYYLYFLVAVFVLAFIFSYVARRPFGKTIKAAMAGSLVICAAPIIDLIASHGQGLNMEYLQPKFHGNLFFRYVSFFGDFKEKGITVGIKGEVLLILIGSFLYFLKNKAGLLKSLFGLWIIYSFLFLFLSMPYAYNFVFKHIGVEIFSKSQPFLINIFLFLFLFILAAYLVFHNRKILWIIYGDISFTRYFHYLLLAILGFTGYYISYPVIINNTNVFNYVFIPAALFFAFAYSTVTNNIIDQDIDKVTNSYRALPAGKINLSQYSFLQWPLLALALTYSLASGFRFFFLILCFIGCYYLYSMPPLRLKRAPIISKLIVSINSLIAIFLGYVFMDANSLRIFPVEIILFFLIAFTLAENFIDLKDYEGDKKEGIRTLPVMLGLRRSQFLIGIFFLIGYPAAFFLFQSLPLIYLFIFIAGGIIQFFLINRKDYSEKPVFLAYLLTLAGIIALVSTY